MDRKRESTLLMARAREMIQTGRETATDAYKAQACARERVQDSKARVGGSKKSTAMDTDILQSVQSTCKQARELRGRARTVREEVH